MGAGRGKNRRARTTIERLYNPNVLHRIKGVVTGVDSTYESSFTISSPGLEVSVFPQEIRYDQYSSSYQLGAAISGTRARPLIDGSLGFQPPHGDDIPSSARANTDHTRWHRLSELDGKDVEIFVPYSGEDSLGHLNLLVDGEAVRVGTTRVSYGHGETGEALYCEPMTDLYERGGGATRGQSWEDYVSQNKLGGRGAFKRYVNEAPTDLGDTRQIAKTYKQYNKFLANLLDEAVTQGVIVLPSGISASDVKIECKRNYAYKALGEYAIEVSSDKSLTKMPRRVGIFTYDDSFFRDTKLGRVAMRDFASYLTHSVQSLFRA